MKTYPVVKTTCIPKGFKHCEIVFLVDFIFEGEENYLVGEEVEIKTAYLAFIKKELLQLLDSLLLLFRPMIVESNHTYFVALKDNMDINKTTTTIKQLLVEANQFTKETMTISASLNEAILMLEGREPTIFKAKRIGGLLVNAEAYTHKRIYAKGKINKDSLSCVTPYSEFKITRHKK